jgi:hypothetical protein
MGARWPCEGDHLPPICCASIPLFHLTERYRGFILLGFDARMAAICAPSLGSPIHLAFCGRWPLESAA